MTLRETLYWCTQSEQGTLCLASVGSFFSP